MMIPAYCTNCLHLLTDTVRDPVVADGVDVTDDQIETCAAFPAGIPDPILRGDVDHSKPYPGDHGIGFASQVAAAP